MVQTCETERLFIRTLSLDDVSELTTILSDPEVMKYSIQAFAIKRRRGGLLNGAWRTMQLTVSGRGR